MGKKVGYIRVSHHSMTHEQQRMRLKEAGCEDIYEEVDELRSVFSSLLERLNSGDILHVIKLDRMAKSLSDLHKTAQKLSEKRVDLVVLDQGIDTSSVSGKEMLHVLGAVAEFERDLINERAKKGILSAKKRGVKFGKPRKLSHKDVMSIYNLMQMGESVPSLASMYGVSKNTIYRAIERLKLDKNV